jgi:hypothetical protein
MAHTRHEETEMMQNTLSTKREAAARALRWAGLGGLVVLSGMLGGCYTGYGYGGYYRPAYVSPSYGYGYGYGCSVRRRYDPWSGTYRVRRVCY